MGTPFMGEIKIVAFNFAPRGWALCNGQFLPINQNQALFSLFGTQYGGNGQTTFALPDLRGRVPLHVGSSHTIGERAGQESHTVIISELPMHIHGVQGSATVPDTNNPSGGMLAISNNTYGPPANLTPLSPAAVTNTGGTQPHSNMQPYLVLNFCVALQGAFPSQN